MIRREIELTEGEKEWLLISQVDHALISGELTRRLAEHFSHEVVEAITHHDDGWAEWEADPRINPAIGAPYSFLEMPLTEALPIWDRSIAAARQCGPLAGFLVAGHFYSLLSESDHAADGAAIGWLASKRKWRTVWLDEWVRSDAAHSMEGAKRAQHQLMMADLFSLWLCCDAPIAGDDASMLTASHMNSRREKLLKEYKFTPVGFGRRHPTPENPLAAYAWVLAVDPYPFRDVPLSFSLMATAAPVTFYGSWSEFQQASRRVELRWRLVPPVEAGTA